MKIDLIFVGKTNVDYLYEGIEDFLKRLKHYVEVKSKIVEASNFKRGYSHKLVDEECLRILRQVEPGDFVITLDEKGKSYTSNNLAELFIRQMNASRKRIVFVIGGAFGINEDLKSRSDLIMSFSSFTFTHQMIRLLLVEQVYRAMTIIRGESYHH